MNEVNLNEQELKIASDISKKIVLMLGTDMQRDYSEEKIFQIFTLSLAFSIICFLDTYGINKKDLYMKDLSRIVIDIKDEVKKNQSMAAFKDGKKIFEGKIN